MRLSASPFQKHAQLLLFIMAFRNVIYLKSTKSIWTTFNIHSFTHSLTDLVFRCQWQCAIQNSLLNEHAAMDLCLSMSSWLVWLFPDFLFSSFAATEYITVIDTCSPNNKKKEMNITVMQFILIRLSCRNFFFSFYFICSLF